MKTEPIPATAPAAIAPVVAFGRAMCGDPEVAEKREWLVTNGLGGFASGTVAGTLTRRYHGLLFAALKPPVGRTLLVTKLDEVVTYDGRTYALARNRWGSGAVDPQGDSLIERFELEGTIPVWTYALADALLEKRVWMEPDANATYVGYRLTRAREGVTLRAAALVNYRDLHGSTHAGGWQMTVDRLPDGVRVRPFAEAVPFVVRAGRGTLEPAHEWYRDFALSEERERGLDDREDHLHVATFSIDLREGDDVTFLAAVDPSSPRIDGAAAMERRRAHEREALARWEASIPHGAGSAPAWVTQLVLAADQFIVRRPLPEDPDARSIIAGYHWFGDWGRDTMISLPGLTLATGRSEIAAKILETFARYLDRGMLPNFFPDVGEAPSYNSVDAPLWYIEAVRAYLAETADLPFVARLFPTLETIVTYYRDGTRYRIRQDDDGLIVAGEPGVQLTWMDAKVGDWVVTPRIGKPIEINALWYNALCAMAAFANALGRSSSPYAEMAVRTGRGFQRYWSETLGYCYDVLDGPDGNDSAFRPNQLFAVSLYETPFSRERGRTIVDACAAKLLTSHGLRSLGEDDPRFRRRYGGSPFDRDGAYHQGTVWTYLLGPFVEAHLCVNHDIDAAAAFLEPVARALDARGLGTLGEIAEATPPFAFDGAIAQAWSVAEILRVWRLLHARASVRTAPPAR
jgi:predicted glycogen debranching enzyme